MTATTRDVVQRCLDIDTAAERIYAALAGRESRASLTAFWQHMSQEEGEHAGYWRRLLTLADEGVLPELFDDPDSVLADLDVTRDIVSALAIDALQPADLHEAFMIALRLEFYLLHPAFETLFHYVDATAGAEAPEEAYDRHIEEFLDAFRAHGVESPDLELVARVIARLWADHRAAADESQRDPLTGLRNRRGLRAAITPLAHLAQRGGQPIGLMLVDVDGFKQLNDARGHPFGDRVLRRVAETIQGVIRASDVVGRFGGDEFLVFLAGADPGSLPAVAGKIQQAVRDRADELGGVTISLGISHALLGRDVLAGLDEAIAGADRQLYAAKAAGGDQASGDIYVDPSLLESDDDEPTG